MCSIISYLACKVSPQVNLMVFFGNGRQGVGGQPPRYTDTTALKTAVLASLAAHGGHPGHLGGAAHYPRRSRHVVRVVDDEFVL